MKKVLLRVFHCIAQFLATLFRVYVKKHGNEDNDDNRKDENH